MSLRIGVKTDLKDFVTMRDGLPDGLKDVVDFPKDHFLSARDRPLSKDAATAPGALDRATPSDGKVEYADGTKATVDQMARDVTEFLTWAANPEMAERKRMGLRVLLFLMLMTVVTYVVKRRVWSDVH